jgi:hypothetical protein
MPMTTEQRERPTVEPDPDASPFAMPALEGLPFDDDSEEARAMERIIAWSDNDRDDFDD